MSSVPPTSNIEIVGNIKILGLTVDNRLNFQTHINKTISSCGQSLFALRTLKNHGLTNEKLQHVFKTVIIPKLTYALPSFWGFLNQGNKTQMQSFLNRATKFNYYSKNELTINDLVNHADASLFEKILTNLKNLHILHCLLPPKRPTTSYNLRNSFPFVLPDKNDKLFINRMIYANLP